MDPRIDRLRGLLAIGVLLGHTIDLVQVSVSNPSGTLFSMATASRHYYGFVCVIGFIVLSGYCIARSTMSRFSLGDYTVMRVTRVYPLMIVGVLLAALVEWAAYGGPYRPHMWGLGRDDVRKFVAALAGFSGFKGAFGASAPVYTISFELMYYAIWGLAMAAALGRARRALLIAAAAAVLLIVFASPLRARLGWFAGFLPVLGIAVLPGWLLGAALALVQDRVIKVARVMPNWAAWMLFVLVYAYCLDAFPVPFFFASEYVLAAYCTMLSGLYLTIVATWLARPSPVRSATDTWLGEISYPLFVIHGPTIMGLQLAMNAWHIELTFAANLAILLAASFGAAMLMLKFVERPVMAWRRRIRLVSTTTRSSVAAGATS
jgi:peptidoglycan/LPS O-acetylase OafA/YrhL